MKKSILTTCPNFGGHHNDNKLLKSTTTLVVKMKVLNSSSNVMNDGAMQMAGQLVNEQITESFSSHTDPKNTFDVEFHAQSAMYADPQHDFYIDIVDDVKDSKGNSIPGAYGRIDKIGSTQVNRLQVKYIDPNSVVMSADKHNPLQFGYKQSKRTGGHELGHGLSLKHPYNDATPQSSDPSSDLNVHGNENNLMRQSGNSSGTDLNNQQRQQIIDQIKKDHGKVEIHNHYPEKKSPTNK